MHTRLSFTMCQYNTTTTFNYRINIGSQITLSSHSSPFVFLKMNLFKLWYFKLFIVFILQTIFENTRFLHHLKSGSIVIQTYFFQFRTILLFFICLGNNIILLKIVMLEQSDIYENIIIKTSKTWRQRGAFFYHFDDKLHNILICLKINCIILIIAHKNVKYL